ncbi:lipase 1 [Hypoxylon sp. FL1284]|nr:lipase 1 [Hypoxylon sp. FL1284]
MAPSVDITLSPGSDHLLPTKDPWYSAPDNFESSPPGTVLRVRTVPGDPAVFGNAAAAYHILFRTTGSRYQPTWAVTSLITPKKATVFSGYTALLSYQIAYNSPSIDWGPSFRIFQPPLPNHYGIPTDHEKVDTMLGRGWYVSIPDFEGPRAAFGATVQAGHATLDGIRAVLSLAALPGIPLPSSANKFKYAMWGYSGGSVASEKAAELQVQYAPELARGFVGAALGGLVSNLGALYTVTNKTPYTGNLVLVLLGVMNEYPEVDAYMRSRLKTEGSRDVAFLNGREMDSLQAFHAYENHDIFDYFVGGEADFKACEALRKIEQVEWMLGYHGVPEIPLFIYKAIGDEMTPIADTDAHMEHYRRFKASGIQYERNTAGGHVSEIVNGQDRAIKWLASVFNGSYDVVKKGIQSLNVTVDLYKPPSF